MQQPLDASPLPRHAPVQPEPGGKELQRAADLIDGARNPLALAGNGAVRGHAGRALRAFVHNTGIPVAETFMAKGLVDYEDPKALGTVGLQARDYEMAGFDDADLVIAIGYDLVEHSPEALEPATRQADHHDRQRRRRGRSELRPRRRADRGHRPRARAPRGRVHAEPDHGRHEPPARGRDGRAQRRARRRPLPDAPAPGAVGHPRGARARRHPGLATSACTSCGSGGCSPRTSPARC